jgi:hypothetical protein
MLIGVDQRHLHRNNYGNRIFPCHLLADPHLANHQGDYHLDDCCQGDRYLGNHHLHSDGLLQKGYPPVGHHQGDHHHGDSLPGDPLLLSD